MNQRSAAYRWYDRYQAFGDAGLEDRASGPGRVWNRIPDDVRRQIVDLALDEPELSPRELAVTFTDTKGYFVSEASVYSSLPSKRQVATAQTSSTNPGFAGPRYRSTRRVILFRLAAQAHAVVCNGGTCPVQVDAQ